MTQAFTNILSMDFVPFSEAKARLSEKMRVVTGANRRLIITTNGRPTGVLLSYQDYLSLLQQTVTTASDRVIDLNVWKKEQKKRLQVRDSIADLFDLNKLSRKGQKSYKRNKVREFEK